MCDEAHGTLSQRVKRVTAHHACTKAHRHERDCACWAVHRELHTIQTNCESTTNPLWTNLQTKQLHNITTLTILLVQPSNMAAKASVLLVATLVVLSFFSAAHASSCAGDITTAGKDMGVVVADIGSDVAECVWGSKASCSRT